MFADVKVLSEDSERLKNLDASFFLTRKFFCFLLLSVIVWVVVAMTQVQTSAYVCFLLLSVIVWVVVAMTQVQTSAYVVDNYLLLCLGC